MSAPTVVAGAEPSPTAKRRDATATDGNGDNPPRRRALRTHLGTLTGVAVLGVLLWRTGTGPLLGGLRGIDGPTLLTALGIGLVTTVFSAWRWALVARGLRIRLPLGPAVADYYRALFLNAALPGGVLGDVHRAVRHGRSAGDLGRGVRSVVLERAAGQVALALVAVVVLLTMPSPVLTGARHAAPLVGMALVGALAVVLALRMNRAPARRRRALRAMLAEARQALLSRRNLPGVAASSAVVLAGYLAMFVLAARVAGSGASVAVLTPLAVLALLAMTLPLNVGGWGPREGVTAWAFGAAGLGAGTGLGVAVVYGVLSFVASLPGAVVLVVRWYGGMRAGSAAAVGAAGESTTDSGAGTPTRAVGTPTPAVGIPMPASGAPARASGAPTRAAGTTDSPAGSTPAPAVVPDPQPPRPPGGHYPRSPPCRGTPPAVRTEKYAPKESARLASSSFPFSAEPSEGRPMTPESV
ncbi:lysylphosphatidylglycerol synthase domain-containing protein [Streptomyces sp. ZSW22]|nr:lysylphosphatidylglycerol synthase domain-containing protein [Streptomyces sp. ZSW22]MDN3246503.1 lysylphosphatidylglycerol synthase domain-containing protein [Streptomyces sp. ZSW22]